jgi:hypothetical protein
MDITQLLLTAGLGAGVLLVGLMAIVPTAMETGPDAHPDVPPRPHRTAPRRRPGPLRPHRLLRSPAGATAGPGRG